MNSMGQHTENTTSSEVHNQPKKRGGWCRKMLRTLLLIMMLLLLAVVCVICNLGSIVEHIIESNDIEYVGRRVEMNDLGIKLLSGEIDVDDLVVYEDDGVVEFVNIDHLEASLDLAALLDSHVHITSLSHTNPHFGITQSGEEFNFDTLVEFIMDEYVDDDAEDVEEGESWRVTIDNVRVDGGELAYYDKEIDEHWDITKLSLRTPMIRLEDTISEIDCAMQINEGGKLNGVLNLNCQTLDFHFDGALKGFDLADTYKYWTPVVNVTEIGGAIAADVEIEGCVSDILAMNISGDVIADSLAIAGPDGGNLLSAERVEASIADINIKEQRYVFHNVMMDGYATQLHLRHDGGSNFDMLFYGEPEVSIETTSSEVGDDMYDVRERVTVTTSEEVAPMGDMTLRIASLDLKNGALTFSDHTMHEEFSYVLRNIAIRSQNFDIMAKNRITVRANLPKQGTALVQWEGSLSDFYNQSIMTMLTNVDMQGLSTYLEHYTAFPILSGNMTFRSQNVVTNGKLSGTNQLGTYKFAIGNKDRKLDAEYDLPLKFGLFVLTDSNDNIDVDFPISGNIESPEFSYRKIIIKAIGNLLLKIVSSPFEWMAPDKQDAFRHIDIDLLTPGFDAEHYARLDRMAEALKEDGAVRVRLTQRVNYDRAVQRLSDLNLRIAYYNATEGRDSGYLDMLDFARIEDMRLSNRRVSDFADSQLIRRGVDPTNMSPHAKARALYGDMVDEQLLNLMHLRNRLIKEYVTFQHSELDVEAFGVNDIVVEDIKRYKGKDRYTVTLMIEDEEIEMEAETMDEVATEEYYDAYILEDDTETEE